MARSLLAKTYKVWDAQSRPIDQVRGKDNLYDGSNDSSIDTMKKAVSTKPGKRNLRTYLITVTRSSAASRKDSTS